MRGHIPSYDVLRPRDLDHALALLAERGADLRPLAGGTDLMVLVESGALPPTDFLDLSGLDALRGVDVREDEVVLGALTTYREIRRHPVILAELPMLAQAARLTGALAIQNRGTLGGNVANASPAADSPPVLMAYGATVEIVGAQGTREVPYEAFHTGYKELALRPGELIRALRVPRRPGGVHLYRKVGTRRAQAISKVVMAAWATLEDGRVADVRVAYGSVAPTVLRASGVEAALFGQRPSQDVARAAAEAARSEVQPIDDVRSTEAYRRAVAGNLAAEFVQTLAAGVEA